MAFKIQELSADEVRKTQNLRTHEVIPLSQEEVDRMTTDKWSACVGCKYRVKEPGILTKKQGELKEIIYGCTLGQYNLSKELGEVPEQCRLRNIASEDPFKYHYRLEVKAKERNNCSICKVYADGEQFCEDKRLKFISCPCRTCPKFAITEHGCLNETSECKKLCKFEVKREDKQNEQPEA